MDKKIIWSPKAAATLEQIYIYIAQNSEYYASVVIKNIIDIIESIPVFPFSGRIVPEYQNENIREKFYKHYRIVYQITDQCIEIVAIVHGAQMPKDIDNF